MRRRRSPGRLATIVGIAVLTGAPQSAFAQADAKADAKAACISGYEEAQVRRKENRFVEARQSLRTCAAEACPTALRGDCVRWLAEVERSLPSVVLRATDQGADVTDVRVTVDGTVVATKLEGTAIDLDPGSHTVVFERPGRQPVEQHVVLVPGEQLRTLVAKWQTTEATPDPRTDEKGSKPPPETAPHTTRPIPWTVFAAGGIGVAGFLGATYFWLTASAEKDSLRSSCAPFCTEDDQSSLRSAYLGADLSLLVGILGLGAATVLYLGRPSYSVARLSPQVLHAGVGVSIGGAL